jgi:hypothetical protein
MCVNFFEGLAPDLLSFKTYNYFYLQIIFLLILIIYWHSTILDHVLIYNF